MLLEIFLSSIMAKRCKGNGWKLSKNLMAGKITQSVSWWCYVPGLLAADEFVAAAKRAGFSAIDLVPLEHWARVRDGGLQISSAVGHASIELGLNRAEQHARIAQELGANIALAAQWGIPNLVCFSGSRHSATDAEAAHITAAGLARVSGAATAAGVCPRLTIGGVKWLSPNGSPR